MRLNTNRSAWIAWATVCVVWGTTYLAIKVALETIPPFLIGGLRYVVAGGVLLAWLAATRRPIPPRASWPRLAVLGFLMLTIGNGGVTWGEQHLASGFTAVLIATTPFWMVGIDSLLPGGGRMTWRHWTGLSVGFAGIVLLVWPSLTLSRGASTIPGVIALQIACLGWAVGSGFTRRQGVSSSVLGTAALQMLFGGVFLVMLGTLTGEWERLAFSARSLSALLYLIVAGSLVAFAAYSHALNHLPVAVVSLHGYVNPVIAVLLGVLVLHEPFRPSMLAAGAVIVVGIAIVQVPIRTFGRRAPVGAPAQNGRA